MLKTYKHLQNLKKKKMEKAVNLKPRAHALPVFLGRTRIIHED